MTAIDTQIKVAYEENEMSPEEIAGEFGFDLTAVKVALSRTSAKYRKDVKAGAEEDISDDEFREIKRVAKDLALYSENDAVRARMISFLWNEKKGRNNTEKAAPLKLTLIQINEQLRNVKRHTDTKVIPTESVVTEIKDITDNK